MAEVSATREVPTRPVPPDNGLQTLNLGDLRKPILTKEASDLNQPLAEVRGTLQELQGSPPEDPWAGNTTRNNLVPDMSVIARGGVPPSAVRSATPRELSSTEPLPWWKSKLVASALSVLGAVSGLVTGYGVAHRIMRGPAPTPPAPTVPVDEFSPGTASLPGTDESKETGAPTSNSNPTASEASPSPSPTPATHPTPDASSNPSPSVEPTVLPTNEPPTPTTSEPIPANSPQAPEGAPSPNPS